MWFHGGGLVLDAGRSYDPSRLAAEGTVVVAIDYRLGALGFLSQPALASEPGGPSGNYGLMDCLVAPQVLPVGTFLDAYAPEALSGSWARAMVSSDSCLPFTEWPGAGPSPDVTREADQGLARARWDARHGRLSCDNDYINTCSGGAPMDFSERLENLKAKVDELVATARAAAEENRDQLKQRVEQAQDDANQAMEDAKQRADETADRAKSKWAQMKADAAARREDVKAKIDKRADQLDAKAAAADADWAEQDAADASNTMVQRRRRRGRTRLSRASGGWISWCMVPLASMPPRSRRPRRPALRSSRRSCPPSCAASSMSSRRSADASRFAGCCTRRSRRCSAGWGSRRIPGSTPCSTPWRFNGATTGSASTGICGTMLPRPRWRGCRSPSSRRRASTRSSACCRPMSVGASLWWWTVSGAARAWVRHVRGRAKGGVERHPRPHLSTAYVEPRTDTETGPR